MFVGTVGSEFTKDFNSIRYSNHESTLKHYDADRHEIGLDNNGFIKTYSKIESFFAKLFSIFTKVTFNKIKVSNSILELKSTKAYRSLEGKVKAYVPHDLKADPLVRPTFDEQRFIENTDRFLEKMFPGYKSAMEMGEIEAKHVQIRVEQENSTKRAQDELKALLEEVNSVKDEMDTFLSQNLAKANARLRVNKEFTSLETKHDVIRGQREIDARSADYIAKLEAQIATGEVKDAFLKHEKAVQNGEKEEIDLAVEAAILAGVKRVYLDSLEMSSKDSYEDGEEIDPLEDEGIFEEANFVFFKDSPGVAFEKAPLFSPRSIQDTSLIR